MPAGLLTRSGAAERAAPQPDALADAACARSAGDDVAVLLLACMARGARLWGWSRIVLGALPLRGVPGLRFAKALGSGRRGGFGLQPSLSRQGLFAVFDSEAAADAFVASATVEGYRAHAEELCLLKLRATSCRGRWSGHAIGVRAAAAGGPVASLTRASIRPLKAHRFWAHSPPAEVSLQQADGCLLAVGLGEAPLLRQATFSLWRDQAAMDAYARGGAHGQAIRGALQEGWFSESMFVRFQPLSIRGRWQGVLHG
jgi:quinol monooxygenase YgiN